MSDWYWSSFGIGGTITPSRLKRLKKCFDDNINYNFGNADFDGCLEECVVLGGCDHLELEGECAEGITDMENLCKEFGLTFIRYWDHENHGKYKHTWTPGMKDIRITGIDTDQYEYITVDTLKNIINYAFLTKREAPTKMGDTDLLMQARVKELLEGTAHDPKEYLLRYIRENHPDDPIIPPFIVKG
jgi:hypothetical protein